MSLFQNFAIIIIGFLLSRIIIERDIHYLLINNILKTQGSTISYFVSSILYISYFMSLFFPNTIVVISLIPLIKSILEKIKDESVKRRSITNFVLALIYGSNIGGMGSMIGASSNLFFLGFIEMKNIPGKENITFFSWLIIGLPASFILVVISHFILKIGEKDVPISGVVSNKEKLKIEFSYKKYSFFFAVNIVLIIVLSAIQFFYKPESVFLGMNIIDMIFFFYLVFFIFIAFILPKEKFNANKIIKNFSYVIISLIFSPLIFISEFINELKSRYGFKNLNNLIEKFLNLIFSSIWFFLFKERVKCIKDKNNFSLISINRLIYDLPFFGLAFMSIVIIFVYLILRIGDNPLTPELDGYVYSFIKGLSKNMVQHRYNLFLILLILNCVTVFFTEIVSNSTVIIIMFSLIISLYPILGLNPLYLMLAISVSSTAAFMSPIASPVNAIAFASIKGVSLRRMILKGFVLNIASSLWITIVFYSIYKF